MASVLNLLGSLSSLNELQSEDMKLSQKIELKKEAIEIIFSAFFRLAPKTFYEQGQFYEKIKNYETFISLIDDLPPSFRTFWSNAENQKTFKEIALVFHKTFNEIAAKDGPDYRFEKTSAAKLAMQVYEEETRLASYFEDKSSKRASYEYLVDRLSGAVIDKPSANWTQIVRQERDKVGAKALELFGSFNRAILNFKFKIGSEILGVEEEETNLGSINLEMKPSFTNKGAIIFNLTSEDEDKFSQYKGIFKERGSYLVLQSLTEYNSVGKRHKIDKQYLDQHLIQFFLGFFISYKSDTKTLLIPFDALEKFGGLRDLLTVYGFKLYKNQKKYLYGIKKEAAENLFTEEACVLKIGHQIKNYSFTSSRVETAEEHKGLIEESEDVFIKFT
ncbi:hypothetical protein [Criblamydia sequanensis]|uniref:Uncharacterized protein n=1 Tax=Candidatus Criblamydia sequanensis CRIB-18 TaxID=1437425 RepID=A0A090D003_9BACT|nr:hypothetical protein [Criblamydia sequanensis]CDR34767.1 hypothetical protein CSEC_1960 [Criblamydia sequanensis CRIB-18]